MKVPPILISTRKVWDRADHCAFSDLFFHQGSWFLSFREGKDHVESGGGRIRILMSHSQEPGEFTPIFSIEKPGVDLRDPKLSLHPTGDMFLLCGIVEMGSSGRPSHIQTAVSFEGSFEALHPVYKSNYWIWRISWFQGQGYGVAYPLDKNSAPELVKTEDGRKFEKICEFDFPMTEATLRNGENGQLVLLGRVRGEKAVLGFSDPPYETWFFLKTGFDLHGPDLLLLNSKEIYLGGRMIYLSPYGHVTKCGLVEKWEMSMKRQLIFPSSGDTGYPSFQYRGGILWVAYHSGDEGSSQIYLAKVMLGQSEI